MRPYKYVAVAIAVAVVIVISAAQTSSKGKQLFESRCTGCHSLDTDKEGPRLRGVYGRAAGSVSSFEYSEALKASKIEWNDQTLDQWLTDPDKRVPGNGMAFRVQNAEERAAIIAYLKQITAQ
jgi:cytochrome c